MKSRIIKILCAVGICILLVLGIISFNCDWEEIEALTAYYYPEKIFYDLNGTPIENTGEFSDKMSFEPKEYASIKIKCDIFMMKGEIESLALRDKNEKVIKEWTSPIASFEEELEKNLFTQLDLITQQGSEGSEGQVTVTVYGKPKLITRIKREINYIKGY